MDNLFSEKLIYYLGFQFKINIVLGFQFKMNQGLFAAGLVFIPSP